MDLSLTPQRAPAAAPHAVTADGFERDVLQVSMQAPVVVDFWAPWCGPCRQLMPMLEKAVAAAGGAVKMVTVDIDANPELAQIFRVQSVPTVYAFFQGQPVDGFTGVKTESELNAFVTKLAARAAVPADDTPSGAAAAKLMTEEADALFKSGNTDAAMEKYSLALDADPESHAALGGIGWCLAASGDLESVRALAAELSDAQKAEPRLKGLLFLLETADTAPETPGLDKKVEASPKDHAARHDLALQRLAVADLAGAIDALVELTRRDREWQEQKARKLLLALFDAMGPHHPLTAQGRRKLSAVLFS